MSYMDVLEICVWLIVISKQELECNIHVRTWNIKSTHNNYYLVDLELLLAFGVSLDLSQTKDIIEVNLTCYVLTRNVLNSYLN